MKIVKKIAAFLAMTMIIFMSPVISHADVRSEEGLVVDYADILSDSEEDTLEARLQDISSRHGMDVAILTVDSLEGKSAMAYADDFYDYNGYGQNGSKDGVLLLLSMDGRDWWFTTTGTAIKAFTDANQNYIFSSSNVLGYFGDDDWFGGFKAYADNCDECITAFENGTRFPKATIKTYMGFLAGSFVLALIITIVVMGGYSAQLKTVAKKAGATDYFVRDSLRITESRDTFLYSNVTKTERQQSSGSSTHISSSGTSHGGSGGKF